MLKLIFSLLAFSCNCYGQEIKKFSSKGMELFYEEKGKGPALYILTGGPGAPGRSLLPDHAPGLL